MARVVAREWREIPGRYNLIGTKCGCCGRIFFPGRAFCPDCRRASIGRMEPFRLNRKGRVYSFSVIHGSEKINQRMSPYAVAMIQNDDGVMLEGQLVDVDVTKIEIGMRVRAVLRKLDEDGKAGVIHYGFKFVPDCDAEPKQRDRRGPRRRGPGQIPSPASAGAFPIFLSYRNLPTACGLLGNIIIRIFQSKNMK